MIIRNYVKGTKNVVLEYFDDLRTIGYNRAEGDKTYKGVIMDTETTGLGADDEVIQLALVVFTFDNRFNIISQDTTFSWFQEPRNKTISETITKITGITNEMVKGESIDWPMVEEIIKDAKIIIAHNASFDRRQMAAIPEGDCFRDKVWACSANDVPWQSHLLNTTKLDYLCWNYGFYYRAHSAEADCSATLRLIAQKLPDGSKIFEHILRAAFQKEIIVYAWKSPFETKDILKSSGYNWDGNQKVWHKKITADLLDAEEEFLTSHVYSDGNMFGEFREISNKDRYL